jgi:hypothetical protein
MATETRTASAASNVAERFEKSINAALVEVGEKFELYSTLASIGPATPHEVAERTGISANQIDHWLTEQAEAGYLVHNVTTGRFSPWCDIGRN